MQAPLGGLAGLNQFRTRAPESDASVISDSLITESVRFDRGFLPQTLLSKVPSFTSGQCLVVTH